MSDIATPKLAQPAMTEQTCLPSPFGLSDYGEAFSEMLLVPLHPQLLRKNDVYAMFADLQLLGLSPRH